MYKELILEDLYFVIRNGLEQREPVDASHKRGKVIACASW